MPPSTTALLRALAALAIAAGVVGSATTGVRAATISLAGTVRDFQDTHPDFQSYLGADPGIVRPVIGADRKPVYAGRAGNPTTTGQAEFDQWYRDAPGVNLSQPLTIQLDNALNADPRVYTFDDDDFFPVDGQLWGNQGRIHNYHFTFELHAPFTYRSGQFFQFAGDDDLWVFIDDRLVIDLGGVHGRLTGTIDLDSLGLTEGATYDFDLFFAERYTTESHFRIDTSIALGATDTPEPTPTPTPTATATPTPTPIPTVALCVCDFVRRRVPPEVVADALANPAGYYGWRYLLDPGKPPGPENPPRECLSLQHRGVPYHPLWNLPIWRAGCP